MSSLETQRAARLQVSIANLRNQSKKDGRFFEIAEKSSTKTYGDAIIEIMALNDTRRSNVCIQDRTLFMRSYHSDNTLAKRCKRIMQDRDRRVSGLTQQTQNLRSQYSTFVRSKTIISKMSVDHIELGKSKLMTAATPDFVPPTDAFYLCRRNKIQHRTMANPERVSSLLSRARSLLQISDLQKLKENRKSKSAHCVDKAVKSEKDQIESTEQQNHHLPKEKLNFASSFYVKTGTDSDNQKIKLTETNNVAPQTTISEEEEEEEEIIEKEDSKPPEVSETEIGNKMRQFYDKIDEEDPDREENDNPNGKNYLIYDLPQPTTTPRQRKKVNSSRVKLPPLSHETSNIIDTNHNLEQSVPITNLSQVRIVPPSMNILEEQMKQEAAVKYPHCSSDRCAIRVAMSRDTRPIADKLHSVTSTRDLMLIRKMLDSKRDLLADREKRLKKLRRRDSAKVKAKSF